MRGVAFLISRGMWLLGASSLPCSLPTRGAPAAALLLPPTDCPPPIRRPIHPPTHPTNQTHPPPIHLSTCRVKEAMVDSANERITDLKRSAAEAQVCCGSLSVCAQRYGLLMAASFLPWGCFRTGAQCCVALLIGLLTLPPTHPSTLPGGCC